VQRTADDIGHNDGLVVGVGLEADSSSDCRCRAQYVVLKAPARGVLESMNGDRCRLAAVEDLATVLVLVLFPRSRACWAALTPTRRD
jgi:hypothetical protein